MIRQAHTYLVGAMGGATLIAIAIAVFVMLVSAQVFRDWPIAALGDGNEAAEVSQAQPVGGAGAAADGSDSGGKADLTRGGGGADRAKAGGGVDAARGGGSLAVNGGAVGGDGESVREDSGTPGASGGGGGSGDAAGGGAPQATSAPSGGGAVSSGGGGGKSTAGSGGGSGGSTSSPPTSGQVTETVNGTVNKVDEAALGGTLDNSSVTEVTEGVVNGVAGPESPVGKVVDEAVGAVGGLLNPNR
jgi:hypothetical protein